MTWFLEGCEQFLILLLCSVWFFPTEKEILKTQLVSTRLLLHSSDCSLLLVLPASWGNSESKVARSYRSQCYAPPCFQKLRRETDKVCQLELNMSFELFMTKYTEMSILYSQASWTRICVILGSHLSLHFSHTVNPVKEGMGMGCRSENCPTPRERHNQPGNGEQGSVRLCEAEEKRAEIDSLNAAVMSLWLW